MAQSSANVNVALNLNSASFQTGAEKARRAMQQALGGIEQDTKRTANSLQSLTTGIKSAAVAFGVGFGIQKITQGITQFATAVVTSGDKLDQLKLKLNFSVGEGAFTQVALSAQKLGTSVETVGATMSRLGIALKDVGTNRADLTTVTETLIQMGRVSGRTGQEIESALTQFSQGLSKGRLDGDELKSVLEAMPPLAQALAKELGVSVGELRDLGAEGKITANVSLRAILNIAKEIDEQFSSLGENLDQSTSRMNASFTKLFAAIDESLQVSDFYKFLQGGAADMADQLTKQLESGGIGKALFGTLLEGKTRFSAPDLAPLEAAQKKLADIQKQITEHAAGRGGATFLGELQLEAVETTKEIERLTGAIERTEHASANALRATQKAVASPAPRDVSSKALFPDTTAQQIEDQKKRVEELAEAERKLADTRIAAGEHAASASTAAQERRIADEERAVEAIRRLEEDRANDLADALARDQQELDRHLEDKRRAYADAYQQIADDNEKALEDEQSVRDRDAERLADIYAQPFKDLATNFSRTLSSGIQDALSGDFDFSTFAEGFGDIFADTLAASITAALVPALTSAAESFGDYLTNALKSGTANVPGLTAGGAALGGAAFGGIAGSLYGAYAPGMKPGNFAGIGGGLGGGLGGAAGFALSGGNPLGALAGAGIGSLLGSIGGGLFGGQNDLGNDRSAQAYRSGRGITYGDTSFSPENRDITQGVLDQVTALQKALEDAGGAIADFGLRVEAGNKSGITVNGKKFPDAQAAMAASLEILIGNTSGLSPTRQTVLANTKAKDAPGIVADLAIGEQFDALTFTGSELTRQLVALDAQMASFGKQAQALGLDINAVAAAHEKERQALIDAQAAEQNAIRAAIEGLAPSGNAVEIVLAQLNDQVQELAKAATAAGLPLDALAAAHQRAAAQIVAANAQLQQSLALQVSALDPSSDKLSVALGQLNQQVQQLAAQITASGGSLDELAGAHQRAAADIVSQFQEQQRLQEQQAKDEQRRLAEQIKEQQAQARAEAAARQSQIQNFQAQMTLLEADPLHAIVIGINENIRQLIEQGKALGLTAQGEAQIRAAGRRLEATAIADFNAAQAEQIRNFQQQVFLLEADPLSAALAQIRERFRELIEQGRSLNIKPSDEANIRAAQARAEAAARTRAALDQEGFTLQLRGIGAASNDAGLQTAELALQMKELTIRATELGVPLNLVTAASARATQALQDQLALAKSSVQEQILAARGESGLTEQLRVLDIQMRELAKAAAAVGIPVAEVTAAHVAAAAKLRAAAENAKQSVLDKIIDLGGGSEFINQLRSLDRQLFDLANAAKEAGIPLSQVTAAGDQARAAIIAQNEERKRQLRNQVDEIGQFGSPLARSLGDLQSKVEDLRKELIEAGLPIDRLAEAHARAAQRIRDDWDKTLRDMQKQLRDMPQTILEAQRGAAGAIDAFLNPFKAALGAGGIGQGVYAPQTLSASALTEFRETLKQSRTGDTAALSSLVGAGQGAISQARATYGSTEAFAAVFREVERGLREQEGVLEAKRDGLLSQIGTYQKETVDELVRLRVQAIADLRADFAKLSRDLIVAVEAGN